MKAWKVLLVLVTVSLINCRKESPFSNIQQVKDPNKIDIQEVKAFFESEKTKIINASTSNLAISSHTNPVQVQHTLNDFLNANPSWDKVINESFSNGKPFLVIPLIDNTKFSRYYEFIDSKLKVAHKIKLPYAQLTVERDTTQGKKYKLRVMQLIPDYNYYQMHSFSRIKKDFSGIQYMYTLNGSIITGAIYKNGKIVTHILSSSNNLSASLSIGENIKNTGRRSPSIAVQSTTGCVVIQVCDWIRTCTINDPYGRTETQVIGTSTYSSDGGCATPVAMYNPNCGDYVLQDHGIHYKTSCFDGAGNLDENLPPPSYTVSSGGDTGIGSPSDPYFPSKISEAERIICPSNFIFVSTVSDGSYQEATITGIHKDLHYLDLSTFEWINREVIIPELHFGLPKKGTYLQITESEAAIKAADAFNIGEMAMRRAFLNDPYLQSAQLALIWVKRMQEAMADVTLLSGRVSRTGTNIAPRVPYASCQ